MGKHRGGQQHGPLVLLALTALALPAPSAANVALPKILQERLLQAAEKARATQAVAEAAARAAFLAPQPRSPVAHDQARQAQRGAVALVAASAEAGPGASTKPVVAVHQNVLEAPPPLSESARLRQENERLRHEQSELAEDVLRLRQQALEREEQWQKDRAKLTQQDSELRAEDAKLRQEDSSLREALARAEVSGGRRRVASLAFSGSTSAQGLSRAGTVTIVAVSVAVLGCLLSLYFCGGWFWDDPETDEDEETLRDLVDRSSGSMSCAGCMRCICRPYVFTFTCGVLFVSGIFGLVLWEMGLLQPILSQLAVYAYIMGIVALFVGMLAYEIWVLVARSLRVILDKMHHPLAKAKKKMLRQRNKFLDWCDDGDYNPTISSDGRSQGERERRTAYWSQGSQRSRLGEPQMNALR